MDPEAHLMNGKRVARHDLGIDVQMSSDATMITREEIKIHTSLFLHRSISDHYWVSLTFLLWHVVGDEAELCPPPRSSSSSYS